MFGKLTSEEIEEVLAHQVIGRIACHAEDITYVVPISYAYDGKYIYGHTYEGLKLALMRINPKVCFQTDNMSNMANWKSVITWGEFEELTEAGLRDDALRILEKRVLPMISSETTHLSPQWPFPTSDKDAVKGTFFRILLTQKTGRFENNTDGSYLLPD
jgi:uncharacterized protein